VLSAKDEQTARKMYTRTAFYFVGRFGLPGLWGAAALVYFSFNGGLPAGLNSLTAMPAYLAKILPVGIIGLVIAGMLAAEMSTDSGYLLTWSTVIYNDLIMPCLRRSPAPKTRLLLTRGIVLAIGLFLLVYGLWYELPGNAWDYLAVTGNIYLASVFTLLVAGLYWKRANRSGAYAALVLGAIGPLTFLIFNLIVVKAGHLFATPPASPSWLEKMLLNFHQAFPGGKTIPAAAAGASSFALAFLGMFVGTLLSSPPPQVAETSKSIA
jgi:SSS family solute:Na+ symporter